METTVLTEKKNKFKIIYKQTILNFDGDFDSGNLNWAGLDLDGQQIQVWFGKDKEIKPSSRCWFYFTIEGDCKFLPVKLHLKKVNSLTSAAKIYDLYRPVIKYEGGEWQRHEFPVQFEITPENDINFKMTIHLIQSKKISIALCYPWSIADNDLYLKSLQKQASFRKDLYFNIQTLIMSPEKRPIHLIAISNSEVETFPIDDYIQNLFPNRQTEKHFKMIKKPMILITSRVHPGEIGASYSLNGVIDFLMGGSDLASQILNEFYFLIVPILNPDGVFLGNNRMDSFGQNLNRFYHLPDLEKQPSCYALKALVQNTRKQLFAFFDFHGHSNKKSCFLFGNSINMSRLQTESVLFAKYLSQICDFVEFKSCNFSKKQMSSKDKNEDFSKQGCARVVVHRWTNSPYCYTLQTGLYKNVKVDQKGIERYGQKFYSPQIYKEIGAKMVISLFQIIKKNKEIDEMRKSLSVYIIKLDKMNTKKDKIVKSNKRQTMKQIKKQEQEIPEFRKVTSEKENQQKSASIQQLLRSNKAYILSIQDQYDD